MTVPEPVRTLEGPEGQREDEELDATLCASLLCHVVAPSALSREILPDKRPFLAKERMQDARGGRYDG